MKSNYRGPLVIPHEFINLPLTKLQILVLSVVFTASDLERLYGSDAALAELLGASIRAINIAKQQLIKSNLIRAQGSYLEFNFDAFADPDALKAVLVNTSAARVNKPILAAEKA